MRPVSGRQLFEEGVFTDEVCDWDEDDFEDGLSDVGDRATIISQQSFSALNSSYPNLFNEALLQASPRPQSVTVPKVFYERFDSNNAVPLTEDGTVLKQTLVAGSGPVVSSKDIVSYHYSCYVEGHDQPYATSYLQKFPVRYRIGMGVGNSLPCVGVEIALRSMQNGESALVLIGPEYGYGHLGLRKVGLEISVPRNAWLLWKVDVFCVEQASKCDDLLMLTSAEERHNESFEKLFNAASEEKAKGTMLYHAKDFFKARRCYRMALRLMQESIPRDSGDESKMLALTQKLLRNLAQTSLKLRRNIDCCSYADQALEIDHDDFLALKKKAAALINLAQYAEADKCLSRCERLCSAMDEENLLGLKQERLRLANEKNRSLKTTKDLERVMAKGLFLSSKQRSNEDGDVKKNVCSISSPVLEEKKKKSSGNGLNVSTEFHDLIKEDLDKIVSGSSPSCTFELPHLSRSEIAHIQREAENLGASWSIINTEGDREVLLVQRKPVSNQ